MRRSFFIKEITKCIILFLFMIIFCGGEDISFASTDQNSLPVEELSDAITASSGLPLWGCKAIVGGSSDGSMVIYRDICRDEVLGITRHIESSVPEVERLCYEDWYDEKNKVHYAYDDSEKRYVFFPNEDSEDVEEYLSLEYWLDTESIEGDATYSYGEDTLFETVDGKTVPCKTINATVTRTVMPFIIINAFSDEDFSEKTYNIYTTYLIGIEDGLHLTYFLI